jgi:D-glycerate 3-kinase
VVEGFRPRVQGWFSAVTEQSAANPWRAFAAEFADTLIARKLEGVVAISGGQGAGKSTLAAAVVAALESHGCRAMACSIDDFYLTAARRRVLAQSRHPLFATRGVPGTHDIELAQMTLDALLQGGEVMVPGFDKGADDRLPAAAWRQFDGPLDLVLLEGWCLGARPQAERDLEVPVNDLERTQDPDGVWRRAVNAELGGPYRRLFARFSYLLYLQVPDLAAVRRWRGEQEAALPPTARMSAGELRDFVQHYERLTRWMASDVPKFADLTLVLGEDHAVVGRSARSQ